MTVTIETRRRRRGLVYSVNVYNKQSNCSGVKGRLKENKLIHIIWLPTLGQSYALLSHYLININYVGLISLT